MRRTVDRLRQSRAMLLAALGYAELSWHVHPLNGKRPLLKKWPERASIDPKQIREWFRQYPDANLGIVTGRVSGLLVIDVDDKGGVSGTATFRRLGQELGRLPGTLRVKTPNGVHHYFAYPGIEIRNSAGRLGEGIDIRADGGYVVAPPSRVGRGVYEWLM